MPTEDFTYQGKPGKSGWYAVRACWASDEPLFTDALLWDGQKWPDVPFVSGFHGPHESREEAAAWAADHDPDFED